MRNDFSRSLGLLALLVGCASTPAATTDPTACTGGIAAGNLILSGTGVGTYAGECGIANNVTIKSTATAEEIEAFQRVETIGGMLTIEAGAQALVLPKLRKVTSTLNIGSSAQITSLSAPALEVVNQVQINGAPGLTSVSLPALTDSGTSVQLSGNPVLKAAHIGATKLSINLLVVDNPLLTDLNLARLTQVSNLTIRGNAALASLATLADAVNVSGKWVICNNAALDATWLAAWSAKHTASQGTCN